MVAYTLGKYFAETGDAILIIDVTINGVSPSPKRDKKYVKKIKKFVKELEHELA